MTAAMTMEQKVQKSVRLTVKKKKKSCQRKSWSWEVEEVVVKYEEEKEVVLEERRNLSYQSRRISSQSRRQSCQKSISRKSSCQRRIWRKRSQRSRSQRKYIFSFKVYTTVKRCEINWNVKSTFSVYIVCFPFIN